MVAGTGWLQVWVLPAPPSLTFGALAKETRAIPVSVAWNGQPLPKIPAQSLPSLNRFPAELASRTETSSIAD
jgi:hypothetical protein